MEQTINNLLQRTSMPADKKKATGQHKKNNAGFCKSIFFSSFLIFITVIGAQAQGFHVGVKGGANIFKVDGQSFKQEFLYGYNVGAFAELNFTSSWGIQPEVNFSQTNYRTGTDFHNIYPNGVNDVKGKLNYLTIPLLLSFRPVQFISLQAGPQYGILLNSDKTLLDNGKDAFKKGDFSLLGGIQLNIANFKLGGRYVVGLSNINDVTTNNKWKNQGFQVYAGFRFF